MALLRGTHPRTGERLASRQALLELRKGQPEESVAAYESRGRVVTGASADEVRERMLSDWWTARGGRGVGGSDAIMLAHRRSDVRDLNARAHFLRVAAGELAAPTLTVAAGDFMVGEEVLCKRNDRDLGVVNGARGVVTSIDASRRSIALRLCEDARAVTIPARYLDAGDVTHAYAMTVHAAQGLSAGQAFILGDESVYREWGYVAFSRARTERSSMQCGARGRWMMPKPSMETRRIGRRQWA